MFGYDVVSNLHERATDESPAVGVTIYTATCKVVDECIGKGGVLVLCHSICVLKWMIGIKAQSLLGGCLCDILSDLIRLPSHH